MGSLPPDFDEKEFGADVRRVVRERGTRLAARLRGRAGQGPADGSNPLEDFVTALFALADRHGIYVSASTTLLIKSLVTIEGVV